MRRRNTFKAVGPRGKALAAILEGRVGEYRVLTLDALHGLYTRSDWSECGLYYRFYIKGVPFERRIRGVACGNAGVPWVTLGGTSYRIASWGAQWP